ncbi:MAG: amino acid adenylation domain-containing protein [Pyrinomonadaceae bacterium]|nr:amino acid adenylation domain-containing protein [Pyrinomonadaceae bacterium]
MLTRAIKNAADQTPEKVAFKCEDNSLTFEELARRTEQLASVLIEQGVKQGDRVGVFLPPSIETAIAIYGIMTAGAAYVPLDANSPPARIAFLLRHCEIKHLISEPNQREKIAEIQNEETDLQHIIGINNDSAAETISWKEVARSQTRELSLGVREDDLAYVIYTSGTTGVPKGIMHTHRSGFSYARLSKELYGVGHRDVFGNHSPLHFDISTFGYFTMPLAKGTTIIIPEAYKRFPASLSQLIEKESLTIWYSVPLALTQMLESGILEKRNLDSLRWILFGGEPFPIAHLRSLLKLMPGARFSNVYGPAEVNQCTFYNFRELPPGETSVPLGKAWDETEIIIVDEYDREVETGKIGECLVQTSTMMKGYIGQPELTKMSLYITEDENSLTRTFYRTGDLVRQNERGELIFVGRRDRQIKIRGYRIELDEIESVLSSHTNVSEAAAYTFRNGDNETSIVAEVVVLKGGDLTEEMLHKHYRKYLPGYIKLDKIRFSRRIPRTAAGKVDHNKLKNEADGKFL